MAHSHQQFHEIMAKRAPIPELTTVDGVVLSVVYVTAEPTFTGVIGGYTTLTGDLDTELASPQTEDSAPTTDGSSNSQNSISQARPTQSQGSTARQSDAAGITSGSRTALATGASTFATATSSFASAGPNTHTAVASPQGTSSSDSSATSPSSSSSNGGLTSGAKAGLAIGMIGLLGIIAILVFYCMGKKKKKQNSFIKQDDEKPVLANKPPAAAPTPMFPRQPPAATNAPRLSLRPVSHMISEFNGSRTSPNPAGTPLNTITEPAMAAKAGASRDQGPPPSPFQRPERLNPNNPFNDPQNPFADPEKSSASVFESKPAPVPVSAPVAAPAPAPASVHPSTPSHTPGTSISSSLASGAVGGMAARAVVAAMNRNSPMNSISMSNKPEPSTEDRTRDLAPVATATLAPIGTGSGPASNQNQSEAAQGSVYRVLMDFKPSMDDELELSTGQLVRLLHEYDDGWALCIRLDRSQQGVVPRTCLATKPSKPKPSHLGQYARPPGSASGRESPMGRPMSPNGRPMSPQGRPLSPHGRPISPASGIQNRMNIPPQGMQGYNGPRQGAPQTGPRQGPPMQGRPMSPGAYNQAPRPLSPGPRPQPKRSMSPGPYGAAAGPKSMTTVQRRRSNSAGAIPMSDRAASPAGLSRPRQGGPMYRSESPGIAL